MYSHTVNSGYYLLSACSLLVTSYCLLSAYTHLIDMAFYEPDLDRLESMWSSDIFGEMMDTNNVLMQEDGFRQQFTVKISF